MELEKMDELYGIAVNMEKDKTSTLYEFARLVEQETLERAAVKLDEEAKRGGYGTWDNMKPSTFIRNLKDNHDKK